MQPARGCSLEDVHSRPEVACSFTGVFGGCLPRIPKADVIEENISTLATRMIRAPSAAERDAKKDSVGGIRYRCLPTVAPPPETIQGFGYWGRCGPILHVTVRRQFVVRFIIQPPFASGTKAPFFPWRVTHLAFLWSAGCSLRQSAARVASLRALDGALQQLPAKQIWYDSFMIPAPDGLP